MKKVVLVVLITLVSVAADWLALLNGWWWVTPVVGLLIGLCVRPARVCVLLTFCVGGLGWGLPLVVLATYAPVGSIATAVEGVVALSSTGGVAIIVLTIIWGCVLSVIGMWVAYAGRSFAASVREAFQSGRIDRSAGNVQ
jgi:hypothetical protein